MRCGITGSSGLIGNALSGTLKQAGDQVVALPRHVTDPQVLEGLDAVIHLAGAPIAVRPWTDERKREIRDSRSIGTRELVESLGSCRNRPSVLISGSAIGFYGSRREEELDESSSAGNGFLAEVGREWESRAAKAREHGVRVVLLRTGIVLAKEGGALPEMARPFRWFAGGPIGDGKQWLSWIHIRDEVELIRFLLQTPVDGPVNATAPNPVRNEEFARELGRAMHRPSRVSTPAFALRAMFGEMAEEVLLSGQKVLPRRALEAGYQYRFPRISDALRDLMG